MAPFKILFQHWVMTMADTSQNDHLFTADVMLGGLSQYLLLAGFDCTYFKQIEDADLAEHAREENRILLSRDRRLIDQCDHTVETVLITSTDSDEQFKRLLSELNLSVHPETMFSRCTKCNTPLVPVEKEDVRDRIPAETREWIDRYKVCPDCDQIYWKGSHYEDTVERFRRMGVLESGPNE